MFSFLFGKSPEPAPSVMSNGLFVIGALIPKLGEHKLTDQESFSLIHKEYPHLARGSIMNPRWHIFTLRDACSIPANLDEDTVMETARKGFSAAALEVDPRNVDFGDRHYLLLSYGVGSIQPPPSTQSASLTRSGVCNGYLLVPKSLGTVEDACRSARLFHLTDHVHWPDYDTADYYAIGHMYGPNSNIKRALEIAKNNQCTLEPVYATTLPHNINGDFVDLFGIRYTRVEYHFAGAEANVFKATVDLINV